MRLCFWLVVLVWALGVSTPAGAQDASGEVGEDLAEDALNTETADPVALALRDEVVAQGAANNPLGQARAIAALALHLEQRLIGASGEVRLSRLERLREVWGELGALRAEHPNVVPAGIARARATALSRAIAQMRPRESPIASTPPE